MLRSLMTAVTGVRVHQTMLDVTGNNIANINTTGFKKDFTIFQDLLYQTSVSSTGPGDNRGGVNPGQVGLGTRVGAIETLHSQGFAQYTGNKTDMMISGEGYFVLRDGGSRIYTRAGNFTLDANNTLVHSGTGYQVEGYRMVRDPNNPTQFIMDGDVSDIVIPMGETMEARATTVVGYKGNLDSRSDVYLPTGFSNTPGNAGVSDEVQVVIEGQTYIMKMTSNFGSGITIQTGFSSATLNASTAIVMTVGGIADGYLRFSSSDTLGGTIDICTSVGATPYRTYSWTYDNTTGDLKFFNAQGSTVFHDNMHSHMQYSSFSIEQDGVTYNCVAEFNAKELEDDEPVTMNVWYQGTSLSVGRAQFSVSFNPDGTFDTVTPPYFNYSVGGIGRVDPYAPVFRIDPSTNGTSLEILAGRSSNVDITDVSQLSTWGTINQGGIQQSKITIYDCQGKEPEEGVPYTLEVTFKKLAENVWRWEASFPDQENLMPTPKSGVLVFDDSCKLVYVDQPGSLSVDIQVPFGLEGTSLQTITLDFSGEKVIENYDPVNDALKGITQYASDGTAKGYYQDGYQMGTMNDYSVGQDGTITGVFTNGQTQPIYRLALAQFANPMGLEKIGNTMFRQSVNSGLAMISAASVDGSGTITSGSLEMSNVDLTEEFTRLIISQRGFQANTRVVTTSDQILEEVVNMKR
ncbi:MAG: flagellar hook-basal body complex protein [Synergistaceae bacterium]|jgi:flagellar hook protein FlgE|nr:flagellar hook-basal body complex protein [Synergistaceae bacterium]